MNIIFLVGIKDMKGIILTTAVITENQSFIHFLFILVYGINTKSEERIGNQAI